jgi:hypothetical protein
MNTELKTKFNIYFDNYSNNYYKKNIKLANIIIDYASDNEFYDHPLKIFTSEFPSKDEYQYEYPKIKTIIEDIILSNYFKLLIENFINIENKIFIIKNIELNGKKINCSYFEFSYTIIPII